MIQKEKRGCVNVEQKGHGEAAQCGSDYYGTIYQCSRCKGLRLALATALLSEVIAEADAWAKETGLAETDDPAGHLLTRIRDFLKGA